MTSSDTAPENSDARPPFVAVVEAARNLESHPALDGDHPLVRDLRRALQDMDDTERRDARPPFFDIERRAADGLADDGPEALTGAKTQALIDIRDMARDVLTEAIAHGAERAAEGDAPWDVVLADNDRLRDQRRIAFVALDRIGAWLNEASGDFEELPNDLPSMRCENPAHHERQAPGFRCDECYSTWWACDLTPQPGAYHVEAYIHGALKAMR